MSTVRPIIDKGIPGQYRNTPLITPSKPSARKAKPIRAAAHRSVIAVAQIAELVAA
jgi:hypothetical protein